MPILPIQLLLLLFVAFALVRVVARFRAKEIRAHEFILWILLWAAIAVVVVRPSAASHVANILGVGRGTDLVLYASVAALFYLSFRILVRLERMERNITKVVREIALRGERNNRPTGNEGGGEL